MCRIYQEAMKRRLKTLVRSIIAVFVALFYLIISIRAPVEVEFCQEVPK